MKNFKLGCLVALTCVSALATSGCEWVALGIALSNDDDCDGYEDCCYDDECCMDECCYGDCWAPPPDPPSEPPTVDVSLPTWPPVGPAGAVTVSASTSTSSLDAATFSFRNVVSKPFNGSTTVSASGSELGEGFGDLGIVVDDLDGAWTERQVTGVLVDLTPPTAYLDKTVLPATGADLQFWIADAWVVSGWSLDIDGQTFSDQLEPGYPDTIGVEWDYSFVSIPVDTIGNGTFSGVLTVFDAAGNATTVDLPLTIDGVAPEAGIPSPTEGEVLDGTFQLTATASDDVPLPVAIEIRVGGALVATGASPQTTITLSTDEFPQGPTEISVVAVDEAGNRSPAVTRNVVFGSEPPPQ